MTFCALVTQVRMGCGRAADEGPLPDQRRSVVVSVCCCDDPFLCRTSRRLVMGDARSRGSVGRWLSFESSHLSRGSAKLRLGLSSHDKSHLRARGRAGWTASSLGSGGLESSCEGDAPVGARCRSDPSQSVESSTLPRERGLRLSCCLSDENPCLC